MGDGNITVPRYCTCGPEEPARGSRRRSLPTSQLRSRGHKRFEYARQRGNRPPVAQDTFDVERIIKVECQRPRRRPRIKVARSRGRKGPSDCVHAWILASSIDHQSPIPNLPSSNFQILMSQRRPDLEARKAKRTKVEGSATPQRLSNGSTFCCRSNQPRANHAVPKLTLKQDQYGLDCPGPSP